MVRMLLCITLSCCATGLALPTLAAGHDDLDARSISKVYKEAARKSKGHPPERGTQPIDAFKRTALKEHPHFGLNRYLSLLITDVDTVSEIKLSEVMDQLAKQAGHGITKEALFHQWWDTANQKPGISGLKLGPYCDDIPPTDKAGNFPYRCPRDQEGAQAKAPTVFTDEPNGSTAYRAIAISNRFDLLSDPQPGDGGGIVYPDCGEYRVIFALNTGRTIMPASGNSPTQIGNKFHRNLISFEARVPNPHPAPQELGQVPEGCRPILDFFYELSDPGLSAKERGTRLHAFFMDGKMPGAGDSLPRPVMSIEHFAFDGGQIRTNQFMNQVIEKPGIPPTYNTPEKPPETSVVPNDWMLREFRTLVINHKQLLIVPDSTKSVPGSILFKNPPGAPPDRRLPLLLKAIHDQTSALLGGKSLYGQFPNTGDINAIRFMTLNVGPNAYESDETNQDEGDVVLAYGNNNAPLANELKKDLSVVHAPGSLTSDNIVDRIRTQTCAGCHQFSDTARTVAAGTFGFDKSNGLGGNAQWPTKACGDVDNTCALGVDQVLLGSSAKHPPMQFTQVSELILTPSVAKGGWRYSISTTVECMLDFRQKFIEIAVGLRPTNTDNCPH